MANTTIAHPTRQSTTRVERGRQLFEERYNEIEHLEGDVWLVPSGNLLTGTYLVNVARARCECAGIAVRDVVCKHITAARIAHAKSRLCSCCRRRVLGRFLSEVTKEDSLLSWFVGDELCADCIRDGYWV